jgi:hypothetical protein
MSSAQQRNKLLRNPDTATTVPQVRYTCAHRSALHPCILLPLRPTEPRGQLAAKKCSIFENHNCCPEAPVLAEQHGNMV